MRDGALAAAIDFGTSGVGDPACGVTDPATGPANLRIIADLIVEHRVQH
ncbi:MAG: hypothetical protein ABI140_02690 [Jatrophihabitantaceae bacterium]